MVPLLAAISLVACKRADSRAMERTIQSAAAELARTPVERVECPAHPSMEAGARFDCQVIFRGGPTLAAHVEVEAHQEFHWELDHFVEPAADTAATIAKATETETGRPVAVDCGSGLLVFVDEGVRCTLTDSAGTWTIAVTEDGKHLHRAPADVAAVERSLRLRGEKAVGPVESVHCDPAEVTAGVTVDCTVVYQGGAQTGAHVAFGAGSTTTTYDRQIVNLETVARDAARPIRDRVGASAEVDCGDGIVEMPAEGVRCDAVQGARRDAFLVTRGPDGELHAAPAATP